MRRQDQSLETPPTLCYVQQRHETFSSPLQRAFCMHDALVCL